MPSNGTNSSGIEYMPESHNIVFKQRMETTDYLANGRMRTHEKWISTSDLSINLSRTYYDDTTFKLHIKEVVRVNLNEY